MIIGTLTVKELISLLEKMPQDLPVISGEYRSIAEPCWKGCVRCALSSVKKGHGRC